MGNDNDTRYQETIKVGVIDNESVDTNRNKKLHCDQKKYIGDQKIFITFTFVILSYFIHVLTFS